MIEAIIVLGCIGAILGFLLGVADKYLQVKEDKRYERLMELLPQFNCGACGYPGCSGFANALLDGEVNRVSLCKPSKPEVRKQIKEYLAQQEEAISVEE